MYRAAKEGQHPVQAMQRLQLEEARQELAAQAQRQANAEKSTASAQSQFAVMEDDFLSGFME